MKKRILAIASAIVFVLISGFITTIFVYRSIFMRFDKAPAVSSDIMECRFMSGENELTGLLYTGGKDELIVLVPGFRAVQDDYSPLAETLKDEGFSVFTFDPTGVGRSGGESQIGFPQVLEDLGSCLDYVENEGLFGCEGLVLLGHSRGGWAACCMAERADAVIAVGALATAMDGVIQGASTYIGDAAYLNYPNLWLWQELKFGPELAEADAVKSLITAKRPALVIHGSRDTVVPMDRFSVWSRRDELENCTFVTLLSLDCGHADALVSDGRANSELVEAVRFFLGIRE